MWERYNMKRGTYGTDKTAELKIRIEPEVKDHLFEKANRAGITVSEYVRRLIVKEKQTA